MKAQVIKILKEKGKADLFTDDRFDTVRRFMKYSMQINAPLNQYLILDPLNKAQYVAGHIIKLFDLKLIK